MQVLKVKKKWKITVTGPESSGKTAITSALSVALGIPWTPEFARYYVAHLGRPYLHSDLKTIGLGQKTWEIWYGLQANPPGTPDLMLCDTDWTVLQIWEQYRFRQTHDFAWEIGYGTPENADLYLLCLPDFPWTPDPLREHPEERDILFRLYENLLRSREANFVTLSGNPDTRLQNALTAIRKLF